MYDLYCIPAVFFANSSRTAFTLAWSVKRSIIVAASALEAWIIPLCPMDIPPQATTDHPCHGAPVGAVATDKVMAKVDALGLFRIHQPVNNPASVCRVFTGVLCHRSCTPL